MSATELQDVRRDAVELLRTEISVHIMDVGLEDIPTDDDITLLSDSGDDDRWVGVFTDDNNAEKIYEVAYNYDLGKFYITTYLMTYCNKYDPPHEY